VEVPPRRPPAIQNRKNVVQEGKENRSFHKREERLEKRTNIRNGCYTITATQAYFFEKGYFFHKKLLRQ